MMKRKNHHILCIQIQIIQINGKCLQTYNLTNEITVFYGKNIAKFNEKYIKNYGENIDKGFILEVDIKFPKWLQSLQWY